MTAEKKSVDDDPGQQQGVGLNLGPRSRDTENQDNGNQRPQKSQTGDAKGDRTGTDHDPDDRPHRSTPGNAEDVRISQRVPEKRLKDHAGRGKRCPDDARKQDPGKTNGE